MPTGEIPFLFGKLRFFGWLGHFSGETGSNGLDLRLVVECFSRLLGLKALYPFCISILYLHYCIYMALLS